MKQRIIFFLLSSVVLQSNAAQAVTPKPVTQQGASVAGGIPAAPPLPPMPSTVGSRRKPAQPERPEGEKKRGEALKLGELRSGIMITPRTINRENAFIPCPPRGLAILLDDSEKKLSGPTTNKLQSTLYCKFPVLVSASLMKNIFDRPTNEHVAQDKEAITKEIKANNGPLRANSYVRDNLANDMVRESFKADEWVIHKVGPSLMLLVPQEMIRNLGFTLEDARHTTSSPELTALEWKLGLKINHMGESLDEKTLSSFLKSYQEPNTRDYFINVLVKPEYQIEHKRLLAAVISAKTEPEKKVAQDMVQEYARTGSSGIFVTNAEYATHTPAAQEQQPQWTLLLAGHGNLVFSIAFLPIADFKTTIDFFEKNITTQFLFVDSCYAGGTNASLAYKNIDEQEPKSLPFPVAMLASYDTETVGYAFHFILNNTTVLLKPSTNFCALSTIIDNPKSTYKNDPYDVALIMQSLLPSLYQLDPDLPSSAIEKNFPQVRPAKRDTFIPLFPGIEIGHVMTETRTKSLNVVEAIKKKGAQWHILYVILQAEASKIGILAKQDIPFPLIINKYGQQQWLPVILSSAPGGAYAVVHRIKECRTDTYHQKIIQDYIDPQYGLRRIFWIDKLIASDGIYTNVIMDVTGRENIKAYITESNGNKAVYTTTIVLGETPTPVSSDYTTTYQQLWDATTASEIQKILTLDPQKELIAATKSGNIAQAAHALTMGADPHGVVEDVGMNLPFLHFIAHSFGNIKNKTEIAQLLITAVKKQTEAHVEAMEKAEEEKYSVAGETKEEKAKRYVAKITKIEQAGAKAVQAYVEQVYDNKTPLVMAVQDSNDALIRVLLANKASIDRIDNGNTALERAIWYKNKEIILLLLNAGADATKGLAYAQLYAFMYPTLYYGPTVKLIQKWMADKKEQAAQSS